MTSPESRTEKRPEILCSECGVRVGQDDLLVRIFSGTRLVSVCLECSPEDREYTREEPCDGCRREIVYELSEHRRLFASCNEECRLAGFAKRRLEAAARARRKNCAHCGTAFTAQRKDARFCGDPCRKQSHYASRGGATLATGDFESQTSGR